MRSKKHKGGDLPAADGALAGEIDGSALPEGITFSASGLTLPPDLRMDEWETVGRFLRVAESAVSWWLGDWLAYGETRYGETYAQALSETDYAYQTLVNARYVAGRIPPEERRESLSWSHHKEVAALDAETRKKMLDAAERNGYGVRALRQRIDEERGKRYANCPHCGARCVIEREGSRTTYRHVT